MQEARVQDAGLLEGDWIRAYAVSMYSEPSGSRRT